MEIPHKLVFGFLNILERLRAEQRAMEIRLAIMKGAAELVGKEPGADPDNLTSREKTTLIKDISETLGVNAESLLKEVGIARSTYYYQLKVCFSKLASAL